MRSSCGIPVSDDERARVIRMLEADRARADEAIALLAAGKTAEAHAKWSTLFNGRFPAWG